LLAFLFDDEGNTYAQSNDKGWYFVIAIDLPDWYGQVASKVEDQQQAVAAETARRLLHFQGHYRKNAVRTRASCQSKRQGRSAGLARRPYLS
jgi:hypothetical protein